MSLDTVNFYYYGKPSSEIPNPTFPPGQKITTQLPSNIVAIRIGAIFIVTVYAAYAIARETGLTILRWPFIIFGITLSAYIAYKHLFIKDPLVEAFYKIAGGKENYDKLPEIKLDGSKRTHENFVMSWDALEHPVHRFSTSNSRKGLLVKALSSSQTKTKLIFVEKLGPYDTRRVIISNLPEWVTSTLTSTLTALNYHKWENPFSTFLSGSSNTRGFYASEIYASISTDDANEFIAQRGLVNRLEPKVVDVTDD
jgi:hypothetical protein